jgi:serine/threonine protein kinase
LVVVQAGGVLHRDVKPANILIDSFGNPRLAVAL